MKKVAWITLFSLIIITLLLPSCTAKTITPSTTTVTGQVSTTTTQAQTTTAVTTSAPITSPTSTSKEMVKNVWGAMVEKPQYGGTITTATTTDFAHFDPWYNWNGTYTASPVQEKLGIGDWTLPPEKWDHRAGFVPVDVLAPNLAESYEMPDPLTIVFHIRQGVNWQNIAPVNGREMNAYDVEYSFQRVCGFGDWAKQGPSPFATQITSPLLISSVTATDKWTVVFKFKSFSFNAFQAIYTESWEGSWIAPKEVLQQYGNYKDWHRLIGTGPFMIQDYVQGSSFTYARNPNYWRTDERFPDLKLQLPFPDYLRVIYMPDFATRTAALRSGKIDILGGLTATQADPIAKSNPELVKITYTNTGGDPYCLSMNMTKAPYNILKVRQALQKAINVDEIVQGYYKGNAIAEPLPLGGPDLIMAGWATGFKDWPQETKDGYTYDVAKAKQLLSEAGYPGGFNVTLTTYAQFTDQEVIQLVKSYWTNIGLNVTISVGESTSALYNMAIAHNYDVIQYGYRGTNYTPFGRDTMPMTGDPLNFSGLADAKYDELAKKFLAATTVNDVKAAACTVGTYWAGLQTSIALPRPYTFTFGQPWLKEWNAEYSIGGGGMLFYTLSSRYWVDQKLKSEITRK